VMVVLVLAVVVIVVVTLSCELLLCLLTVLEVYQFARDAAVAESWLLAHEPYLQSQDFGVSMQLE